MQDTTQVKSNDIEPTQLLQPQEGRIGVTQKPGSTGPKIPGSSISSSTTSLGNITTGNITPMSNNSKNIGTSAKKFSTVYTTTVNATTLAMGAITITSSSSVVTAVAAQDSYINVTINGVVYKLLLAA